MRIGSINERGRSLKVLLVFTTINTYKRIQTDICFGTDVIITIIFFKNSVRKTKEYKVED